MKICSDCSCTTSKLSDGFCFDCLKKKSCKLFFVESNRYFVKDDIDWDYWDIWEKCPEGSDMTDGFIFNSLEDAIIAYRAMEKIHSLIGWSLPTVQLATLYGYKERKRYYLPKNFEIKETRWDKWKKRILFSPFYNMSPYKTIADYMIAHMMEEKMPCI